MKSNIINWWAKTTTVDQRKKHHPLLYHSMDVAHFSGLLFDHNVIGCKGSDLPLQEKGLRSLIRFLGFIHDFGKFSESFQALDPDIFQQLRGRPPEKEKSNHRSAGWALWLDQRVGLWDVFNDWISPENPSDWERSKILRILGQTAFGHHGNPIQLGKDEYMIIKEQFRDQDLEVAKQTFEWGLKHYLSGEKDHISHWGEDQLSFLKRNSWSMNGLITLADWLASDKSNISWDIECSPEEYLDRLQEQDSDERLPSELTPKTPSCDDSFEDLFPQFDSPTPLQEWANNVDLPDGEGSLFILEDQTGSGKTEAALTLSARLISNGNASSIYFGLPTMATSNAMYSRFFDDEAGFQPYERFFQEGESPEIVLSHSQTKQATELNLVLHDRGQNWLTSNRKLSLLADIGVGTVDQAISGILPRFHHTLKLMALNNHVLIVDEVHDYDPYTNKLLEQIITYRAQQQLPTILLSATLSNRQYRSFQDAFDKGAGTDRGHTSLKPDSFPRASKITPDRVNSRDLPSVGEQKTIKTQLLSSEQEVIDVVQGAVDDGQCVAWIRNTVHDARDGFQRLDDICDVHPELFHSRYTLGDRLNIEEDIRSRFGPESTPADRTGQVVIGTQVMEQSLDLDFDLMITDLAPMDRILQRAGRLHRHHRQRADKPKLYIHGPDWEAEPGADWYEEKFPKGAHVYQRHGLLWKTLSVLRQSQTWNIPEESRYLIEQVFQKDKGGIPDELAKRDMKQEGKESAEKTRGRLKAIHVEGGYGHGKITGYSEDTPTRLGKDQTLGRLIKVDEASPKPWDFDQPGENHWASGDFSLPTYSVADHDLSKEKKMIQKAMDIMDDFQPFDSATEHSYDDRIIVPMRKEGECWIGYARDNEDRPVQLCYDPARGFDVKRCND